MAKKGQKYRNFTREEKIKAVKMYLEENKSMNEIEQGYLGYKNCTGCVTRWVIEFRKEGEENAFKKKRGLKKVENEAELRYEILKKFNAFLDKEIKKSSSSSNNLK
jgi:transposase-like protein